MQSNQTILEWIKAALTGDAAIAGSILTALGAIVVALAGAIKWLIEYSKSNRLKRFEKFSAGLPGTSHQDMGKRMDDQPLANVISAS